MVFSSLIFLCVFLPAVLLLYLICPGKLRNFILLLASLLFYAWGEPRYIVVMLFSSVFDYTNGRLIAYCEDRGRQWAKKGILLLSIAGNLGILFFFKYMDFVIRSWNSLTSSHIPLLDLALPIGISFYTFQTMSYTIDVYWGKIKAQKNLVTFSMYVSMFPQLIAGPIIRYQNIESQLETRTITVGRVAAGMQRFLTGLGKKVLLANQIGILWDEIINGNMDSLSVAGAWAGALAFTFQIYFDFSGYSDMAIGLGHMFGFTLSENFRHPYTSKSITEFWRRWHITLGTWFREYVYIPLGGNRKGLPRQIANLFIVWFLTGLWHGASWNFVVWGLYFFVLLLVEKVFLLKEMEHWPVFFRHLYAKLLIVAGWVLFAVEDFGQMGLYLQIMLGIKHPFVNGTALYQLRTYGILFVLLFIASGRMPHLLLKKLRRYMVRTKPRFAVRVGKKLEFAAYSFYTIFILLASIAFLMSGSYNPFLYFRF